MIKIYQTKTPNSNQTNGKAGRLMFVKFHIVLRAADFLIGTELYII